MLYISYRSSYKSRIDHNMYKTNQLELLNSKKGKIVVGCVFKHSNNSNMDVLDFNFLISQPLDKISKEQKQFFSLEVSTITC